MSAIERRGRSCPCSATPRPPRRTPIRPVHSRDRLPLARGAVRIRIGGEEQEIAGRADEDGVLLRRYGANAGSLGEFNNAAQAGSFPPSPRGGRIGRTLRQNALTQRPARKDLHAPDHRLSVEPRPGHTLAGRSHAVLTPVVGCRRDPREVPARSEEGSAGAADGTAQRPSSLPRLWPRARGAPASRHGSGG